MLIFLNLSVEVELATIANKLAPEHFSIMSEEMLKFFHTITMPFQKPHANLAYFFS